MSGYRSWGLAGGGLGASSRVRRGRCEFREMCPRRSNEVGEDALHALRRLLGRRQLLQSAGIRKLHAAGHLPEAIIGELLAIAQAVDVDGWKEGDDRLGLAEADHLPKMGNQIEIAEPREQGAP